MAGVGTINFVQTRLDPNFSTTTKIFMHNTEMRLLLCVTIARCPLNLLLDTGAQTSVLRGRIIHPDALYFPRASIMLTGVTSNSGHRSVGLTFGSVIINDLRFQHEFQIVDDTFHLDADGIIGCDFLMRYKCTIDMVKCELRLQIPVNHPSHEPKTRFELADTTVSQAVGPVVKATDLPKSGSPSNKSGRRKGELKGADEIEVLNSEELPTPVQPSNPRTATNVHGDFPYIEHGIDQLSISTVAEDLPFDRNGIIRYVREFCTDGNVTREDTIPGDTDRLGTLCSSIDLSHCGTKERNAAMRILGDFSHVFHLEGDTLSHTDIVQHTIDLKPGSTPIFIKQYRIPEGNRAEMNRQIDELYANGIIEPCTSEWNFPLILVAKKPNSRGERQYRLVVDFRKLNEVTVPMGFPIPLIDELLEVLGSAKYFTSMDVQSAFHQIMVRPEDRDFLSFQTNFRRMRFVRMPFGLANSPRTWQRAINLVLKDLLGKGVLVYLDDILIYSATFEEHQRLIREVLTRLESHNIKLKPEKARMFAPEVEYLGHIISNDGIRANPKKTECVRDFPVPQNVTQVQSFLGLASYYRRFVPSFSRIAKPLHTLCKKNHLFEWTDACQDAFQKLKDELISDRVLAHVNFTQQMRVTCDACGYGIGATLGQLDPETGGERPILFISRLLRKSELNYSTIEKELLAIVWAVESFRHYLYANTIPFLVITDHRPLVYLMEMKNPSSRLFNWKLKLMEYQFEVVHLKGKMNVVADALSRVVWPEAPERAINLSRGEPKTIRQILVTRWQNAVRCRAMTRSAAKKHQDALDEMELRTKNSDHHDEPKPVDLFVIHENRNLLTEMGDFHHAFYFFSSMKGQMKRKLEKKLFDQTGTALNLPDAPDPYELHSIDDDRTYILMPNVFRSSEQLKMCDMVLSKIITWCTDQHFENVALNIDIEDAPSYFAFKRAVKQMFTGSDFSVTFFLNKVITVTDVDDIQKILRAYHRSLLGGHAGHARTKNRIRKYYYWPTINKDIKDFIQNCPVCEQSKVNRHTRMPMGVRSSASTPFEHVYLDLVGPVNPPSNGGYTYILTGNCELTKFAMATPIVDASALTTARAFVHDVVLRYQLPKVITTDNGTNFTSELFSNVTKLLGIKKLLTTPYNPKANLVERFHRSMGHFMRAFVQQNPCDWDDFVPFAIHSYNNTPHSTTGYAPQELLFGFSAEMPSNLLNEPRPVYNYDSYISELRYRLQYTHKVAKQNLLERAQKNKGYYDQKTNELILEVGDMVNQLKNIKSHKFERPYDGPWEVTKVISPGVVEIRRKNKTRRVLVDSLIKANADYGSSD